jgi:hypothetical protein
MITLEPQFIIDSEGNKISVILPIKDYRALIEELEDLEDVRLYDEAKNSDEPSILMDEAFRMIEQNRKAQ